MLVPFSIKKWLADQTVEVVTKGGQKVEIISTDLVGDYPVLALNTVTGRICHYSKSGYARIDGGPELADLLMELREHNFSKFENALFSIVKPLYPEILTERHVKQIKEQASTLLSIAHEKPE